MPVTVKARFILFAMLGLAGMEGRAAAQKPPSQVQTVPKCASGAAHDLYRLCFQKDAWIVDEPNNSRFTNRDRVEVEVQHFNFLRYTLSFDVKEEKSESYQYLTKLWASLLDPNILQAFALGETAAATDVDEFVQALRDVYRRAQAVDHKITTITGQYKKTGLQQAEATRLRLDVFGPGNAPVCPAAATDLVNLPEFPEPTPGDATTADPLLKCPVQEIMRGLNLSYARLSRLLLIKNEAFTDALGGQRKALYNLVSGAYSDVRKREDSFVSLAEKTIGVETKKAGKHDAGTRVTLTISAVDDGGARTPLADINYFVETTMPLIVHGGLTFSGLRDVTFDKIKRASAFGEEDLFQQTNDANSSKNFSAFLSWSITPVSTTAGPNNSWASLLISLGTDVASPGKKIFAGPSLLLFNRMALTAGVALGKEEEGQAQTLEPNVFRVIRARPKASFFFSLTSKVH